MAVVMASRNYKVYAMNQLFVRIIAFPALQVISLRQWWGTCSPHDLLTWPTSEFSLPKLEHNIMSKRNSVTSRQ